MAVYAGIAIAAVVVVSLAVLLFKKEEEDDNLWEIIKDAHTFATPLTDAEIDDLWRVADADGSGSEPLPRPRPVSFASLPGS